MLFRSIRKTREEKPRRDAEEGRRRGGERRRALGLSSFSSYHRSSPVPESFAEAERPIPCIPFIPVKTAFWTGIKGIRGITEKGGILQTGPEDSPPGQLLHVAPGQLAGLSLSSTPGAYLDFPGFFRLFALAAGAFGEALGASSLWSPRTVLRGQTEKAKHFWQVTARAMGQRVMVYSWGLS